MVATRSSGINGTVTSLSQPSAAADKKPENIFMFIPNQIGAASSLLKELRKHG
jgi:hypothetical protein